MMQEIDKIANLWEKTKNPKYKDEWWEISLKQRPNTKNSLKQFLENSKKLLDEKTIKLINKFRTTSMSDVLSVNTKK